MPAPPPKPEKVCAACGRRFAWRKKWARTWDDVKYCSDACRRGKVSAADADLERRIAALLAARPAGATVCPSEVARAAATGDDDWRPLMEPVRRAARRLADRGVLVFTQAGRVVDPTTAKGPVRLRRA